MVKLIYLNPKVSILFNKETPKKFPLEKQTFTTFTIQNYTGVIRKYHQARQNNNGNEKCKERSKLSICRWYDGLVKNPRKLTNNDDLVR